MVETNPTKILTAKQGSFSLLDATAIAVTNTVVVDKLVNPILNKFTKGNTLFNVLAKVGLASASTMLKGNMKRVGNVLASAFMVSGATEISNKFLGSPTTGANKVPQSNEAVIGGGADFGDSNKTGREGESFI